MDCQLGSRLRALISLISREPTWIRRALPRAVPQCGHGWKDSRDEDFAIPRKMPRFPIGPMSATCRSSMPKLDQLCVNAIRTLSINAVQAANSGHPGTPMAMAPVAYCLWQQFLRFDPQDPVWPNRGRTLGSARRPQGISPIKQPLSGTSGVSLDLRRGNHNRPFRARSRNQCRNGRCPPVVVRSLSPARL
jgi:hypothetical protein